MRILAIDGDSVLRQAWEGSPDDKLVGVYRRVIANIAQSISSWDRTVVAFDGGPGGGVDGFRRARVPDYKATRKDPGAVFRDQRQRVIDGLAHERCTVIVGPVVNVDGASGYCEGDDVLAWVRREYTAIADSESVLRIVSNDGDLEALASESPYVEIFKPNKRRENPVFTAKRIETERGVLPAEIPHLKALMGDTSDNIVTFDGIGEKTAAMLVRVYGNVLDVVARAPDDESIPAKELKKNQRDSLRNGGAEVAARGLWLATLQADLPLDFDIVMNPPDPVARPKEYFEKERQDAQRPTAPTERDDDRQAVAPMTAIAPVASVGINPFALQPNNLGNLYDLALAMQRSGLYGHLPTVEAIMGVILDANERCVPAATALRNAYLIPGTDRRPPKLGWSAAYIAGLVLSSGKADYFELVPEKCDDKQATVRFKRRGRPPGEHTYTIEDAKREGLFEKYASRWPKDPKGMLRCAALRTAARAYFFDVVSGTYMPDELRDRGDDDQDADAANV